MSLHAKGTICFISYRRSDAPQVAKAIYDELVRSFGREGVLMEVDSIPMAVDFVEFIDQAVRDCQVLLAIIGPSWLDARDQFGKRRLDDPADFVRREIESALDCGVDVIPVVVHPASMPPEESLPDAIRGRKRDRSNIPGLDLSP